MWIFRGLQKWALCTESRSNWIECPSQVWRERKSASKYSVFWNFKNHNSWKFEERKTHIGLRIESMVLVILDLANRELTRRRRQSRSMFSTLKPSSLPWFVNKRLIDWNGAVEHTSKINQVDMYLYILFGMKENWLCLPKNLRNMCVYFCQSA